MEQIRYYELRIFSKTNFTDERINKLRESKPSFEFYSDSIQQLSISNKNSKKILDFFINYDTGFFIPEKCDAYEPIGEKFNPNDLSGPLKWLSQPGSALYLKKIKKFKYEGVIENNCLALVWDEDGQPLSKNKESYSKRDPYYLSEIKLFIEYKLIKLKSVDYLIDFFEKLYSVLVGEYGYINDLDGNKLIKKGIMS